MKYVVVAVAVVVAVLACAVGVFRAHYWYTVSWRRALPWSRRAPVLKRLLAVVYEAAAASATKPFLLYGTLLGKVRQDALLCHDFDVDIGVLSAEYDALIVAVRRVCGGPEFKVVRHVFPGQRSTAVVHRETGLNADISPFVPAAGGSALRRDTWYLYTRYVLRECRAQLPASWILPLRPASLEGVSVYVPNDAPALLRCFYGDGYLTPDHVCDPDCNHCYRR